MYYPAQTVPYKPSNDSRRTFQRNNDFHFGHRERGRGFNQSRQLGAPGNNDLQKTEHWCETCDRGFPNLYLLQQHNQQHQKCNIDGCQFIAHPKVITKHIQMQHSSGLFQKISNLNNPEDIKKWRDERKKRYPTKENVEKKEAEIKEKIERGEKMGLRQHRKKYRNENLNETKKGKYSVVAGKKRNNTTVLNTRKKKPRIEKDLPVAEDKRKLKPFTGIQSLLLESDIDTTEDSEHNDFCIEDDDCMAEMKPEMGLNTVKPVVCGALSSLMCDYESSDEENKETSTHVIKENQLDPMNNVSDLNKEINTKSKLSDKDNTKEDQIKNNVDNNEDSGPEEVNIEKDVSLPNEKVKEYHNNDNKKLKQTPLGKQQIQRNFKVPSTLIYKLLHREIQQERNIILQCIRHIIRNNYFDKN